MRVQVRNHGLPALESDLREIPVLFVKEGSRVLREIARDGGQTARRIATRTAGRHGKHYPKAITWDRLVSRFSGFGGGSMKIEYGPDSSLPQGGMSFEEGSRKQRPHHDLANSLDLIRPRFQRDAEALLDGLFWPGARR